jgi:putative thioredoxin
VQCTAAIPVLLLGLKSRSAARRISGRTYEAPPVNASHRFVATSANFLADVIEASSTAPVLVDFWAPWCAPCRQLMPVLDHLVDEYAGRFRLAKVNTDEEQALAGQLGVRSLPTVVLFKDGAPVDHFVGVVPEGEIRALLDRHLPAAAASPLEQVRELKARGDYTGARLLVDQALGRTPDDLELNAELGQLQALAGDVEAARATLTQLEAVEPQHAATRRLAAAIAFRDAITAHPDVDALRARVAADPSDLAARHALAAHDLLAGRGDAALGAWLEMMRSDPGYSDGLARRSLVQAFELLGTTNPLVENARREMSRLLF